MIKIPKHLLIEKTPFFVCSEEVLERQLRRLEAMGLTVRYSVKTNPEECVLRSLNSFSCGFSVSGISNFLKLLSIDAEIEKIQYHERALTKKKAEKLMALGCRKFVLENMSSFDNVKEYLDEDFSIIARLRAKKVGGKYAGDYLPGMGREEVRAVIEECKKKNAKSGVLYHSSSQLEKEDAWEEKFNELSKFKGLDIIDIGGGIPIDYSGRGAGRILKNIEKGIKKLDAKEVITEPGRFIVAPACSLVSRVEMIDGDNIILDCSAYDAHIDTIIADIALPCRLIGGRGDEREYRLLGSSLCNLDVFCKKAKLPKAEPGNLVVFDKAGAYNVSSEFGQGERIKTFLV